MTRDELIALQESIYNKKHRICKHKQGHPESDLQIACVKWFRSVYREPRYMIWSCPNGGQRNAITASIMKAEGQRRGVPDLCIPMSRHGYTHLYIEMKNGKKGVLSKEQKNVIAFLESQGSKCVVCRSFDEFANAVNAYLG